MSVRSSKSDLLEQVITQSLAQDLLEKCSTININLDFVGNYPEFFFFHPDKTVASVKKS